MLTARAGAAGTRGDARQMQHVRDHASSANDCSWMRKTAKTTTMLRKMQAAAWRLHERA